MRRNEIILVGLTTLVLIFGYFFRYSFLTNSLFLKIGAVFALLNYFRTKARWQLFPVYIVATLIVLLWLPETQIFSRGGEIAFGVVGLALTLTSVFLTLLTPLFQLPVLSGKYSVGRINFIRELPQEDQLKMTLWFPAEGQPQAPFLPYHPKPSRAFKGVMGMPGFVFNHLSLVKTHSQKIPAAQIGPPLPLIVYSHGAMSSYVDNTAMVEELASHGYFVLSLHHQFSFEKYGLDGKSARQYDAAVQKQLILDLLEKAVPAQAKHHAIAVKALRSDKELSKLIDWDNCGAIGHSLGGATVTEASLNSMYKATVNMDGPVPRRAVNDLSTPFLYLSSFSPELPDEKLKAKRVKPDFYREVKQYELETVRALFRNSNPEQRWIRFPNTGHLDFTDLPFMVPMLKTKGYQSIPGHIARTNAILDFFDQHLKHLPEKPHVTDSAYEQLAP